MMQRLLTGGLLGLVFALIAACGIGGNTAGERWEEDVLLQTGETMVVDREFRYAGGGIGEGHGPLEYASLDFEYLGSKYHWQGRGLHPIILNVNGSGAPIVVSVIPYCWAWEERGRPSSSYVYEIFSAGAFKVKSIDELDIDRNSNLAVDSRNPKLKMAANLRAGEAYRRVMEGEHNWCR